MPLKPSPDFNILKYLISDYFFERMQDYCNCSDERRCFCDMDDYQEFIEWNVMCFNNLSSERKLMIETLYNLSKEDEVCIMDEDNCVCFTSESIFFNRSGSLVVTYNYH